ncbi:hypothetical protein K2173_008960 [Erythroxylum novogranatense]|uniref:Uncharacterized protein n=1 Tax=Erythroxylum novogranatense TaxID=1862640 RepID=A0AAV8TVW8_9ROSI|nr:hypothetical protein K2173_008960 [Erythroxylum novogranatense]
MASTSNPGGNVPPTEEAFNAALLHQVPFKFFGSETPEQGTARIQEALGDLDTLGIPTAQFTHDAVLKEGCIVDQFLKLQRTFTSHNDEVKASLIQLGIKLDFFVLPMHATVRGFIEFCTYIKSREGQAAVHGVQRRLKLERRAGASGRIDIASLGKALNIQIGEMGSSIKNIRERYGDRIAELRTQLRQLEWDQDREIEAGKNPLPPSAEGYAKAKEMFGNHVRVEEFVEQKVNRDLLVKYIQEKILYYDREFMTKQAVNFRDYLAAIVGEEIAPPPAEGANGNSSPTRGKAKDDTPTSAERADSHREETGGHSSETSIAWRVRGRKRRQPPAGRQPQDQGDTRLARQKAPSHTRGQE